MRYILPCLLAAAAWAQNIEERGAATWPNANHFRVRHEAAAPAGMPIAVNLKLPDAFNPDSLRIVPATPAKVEWRRPNARVSFVSTGERVHYIYFDTGNRGEAKRLPEPFAIGTGDRMTYGRAGVRSRAAVGLWPHPSAFDVDDDGDTDLVVGCADRPFNGTYLFRNIGSNDNPLYDRAEWLAPGSKELTAGDVNGDGAIDIVVSGGYYSDFKRNRMSKYVPIQLQRDFGWGVMTCGRPQIGTVTAALTCWWGSATGVSMGGMTRSRRKANGHAALCMGTCTFTGTSERTPNDAMPRPCVSKALTCTVVRRRRLCTGSEIECSTC
jgi:hypothetical protein